MKNENRKKAKKAKGEQNYKNSVRQAKSFYRENMNIFKTHILKLLENKPYIFSLIDEFLCTASRQRFLTNYKTIIPLNQQKVKQ